MKQAKKVFAIATSVAMVGLTAVNAAALDLSNYPMPFIMDDDGVKTVNAGIVVGANAATQDVLGAIDISASLQREAVTPVTASGSTVSVSGGEEVDNVALNTQLFSSTQTYDDTDLAGFQDKEIRWNDQDISIKDQLELSAGGLAVETYIPGTSFGDDEFGSDPYLVNNAIGSIVYKYVFEDDVNISEVGTSSSEDELEINFLGKELKITSIEDGEMTIEASNEYFLSEGTTLTVDGNEVSLDKVSETAVIITVNGETEVISNNEEETFEDSDDFEVRVDAIFYIEGAENNGANLELGNSLSETVNDGDSLETYGEPEDESDAEWVWEISVTGGLVDYVAATSNMVRELADADGEDERPALKLGESIELPNAYASIEWSGWEDAEQGEYDTLSFDFKSVTLGGSALPVVEISTSATSDSFYMGGTSTKAETVYVHENGTEWALWYDDGDDKVFYSSDVTTSVIFRLNDENINITPANETGNWTVDFPAGQDLSLWVAEVGGEYVQFGTLADDAEAGDLFVGTSDISTSDDDLRTSYGVIIDDPESQLDRDTLDIEVPYAQQFPVVTFSGRGSVVSTSSSSGASSYTINPASLGLGVLDTAAPSLGSKPMIIVGGPLANTVAAEVMGNPTTDEVFETFEEGKALIKYYDDSQALLVAGWGALETQGAANVVADYTSYDFEGTELEVVVTSLNNIEVSSVN